MKKKARNSDQQSQHNPVRALIVADDPQAAKSMRTVLERASGHLEIESVDTIELLQRKLLHDEFEIIISDFTLGKSTALDVLEAIKKSGKDIPLVVVSGPLGDEAAAECIKQGAADFVLKERMARLPVAVAGAIERKKLRDARRRAEKVQRQSGERYQLLFEANPLPMWVFDLSNLRFLAVNEAAIKHYGYSRDEFLAMTIKDTRPTEDIPALLEDLAKIHGEDIRHAGVWRHKKKDGSLIDVEITSQEIDFKDKRTRLVLAVDVTERKRAEEMVRKSEQRFRELVESVEAIVWEAEADRDSHDLRVTFVNQGVEKILGYTPEQWLQTPSFWAKHIHPEDRERALAGEQEVLRSGTPRNVEYRMLAADGRILWFRDFTYAVRGQAGRVERLRGIMLDITERKQLEERFSKAFNASPEPITLSTLADGIYVDVNDSFLDISGYKREEVIGRGTMDLKFWQEPGARTRLLELLSQGPVRDFEMRFATKSGEIRTGQLSADVIDVGGQPCLLTAFKDITERRRTEEALRDSEDRYRDLVEHSRDLICTHDLDGRLLSVNSEPARILGYTVDELLKIQMQDLLAPEVRVKFKDYLTKIRKEGAAEGLLVVQTRNGERRIWEYSNTLRTEGVAQPIVRGMAHDVTERKQAEQALRQSEERFRNLVENATVGIYRSTPDGRIVMGNAALVKMLGYNTIEQLTSRNLETSGFEPGHPRSKFKERVEREGEVIGFEAAWTRTDGTTIFVLESAHVVRDSSGKALYYDGIVEDITERKRAADALVRLKKAVDTSGEVIFMTDRQGIITFVNSEFTRLYGYTEAEVVGKVTPRILKSGNMNPEDYKGFWKTILENRVARLDIINQTKEGRLVDIEASVNPILDERGEITGFLAIQRDITQRQKLELKFRQAQKMEAVGQLAGGVAHDFNNLLTVINGYSDLMLERLKPDDPHQKYVEEIKKAGDRAAGLTRQLLAFSRQQVLAPQVLDLNKIISSVHSMLRRLIGEDIDLVTVEGENLGLVKADPGQIEQVLLNLAVNARDAMPRGGKLTIGTVNIEIGEGYAQDHVPMTTGPFVMVSVSDTGVGMDNEIQKHVFEPFFTTKEKGKGTGLGLSTVYGIVKQSGGYIWLYSEPGHGTTFKVYFPRIDEQPGDAGPVKSKKELSHGNETILLVEDDEAIRKLGRETLEARGFQVLSAANGAEALEVARAHQGTIHLLLTDLVMPGISGRFLAEHMVILRPEMKVLYMSGYTDDVVVRHGGLGASMAFLQKPFTPEALARKVREVLDAGEID